MVSCVLKSKIFHNTVLKDGHCIFDITIADRYFTEVYYMQKY